MSGDDHFIKPDNNPPGATYCAHCGEMVAEDDWPVHSMDAIAGYEKKIAGIRGVLDDAHLLAAGEDSKFAVGLLKRIEKVQRDLGFHP